MKEKSMRFSDLPKWGKYSAWATLAFFVIQVILRIINIKTPVYTFFNILMNLTAAALLVAVARLLIQNWKKSE
ncbi:MAG TPA: hypothetical protein VMV56_12395 [Williamwhitmania sp.]|nr:hypothetical protein [Williamwhitmania sp.]